MPELASMQVEVSHNLDQLVERGVRAIVAAVEQAARELRETHIPAEAPAGPTGALSSPASWDERQVDPLTWVVFPGPEAFYAHIVSGGRQAVETTSKRALTIGGMLRASAGPAPANPFDERAVAAAEGRLDELMFAALSAEGL